MVSGRERGNVNRLNSVDKRDLEKIRIQSIALNFSPHYAYEFDYQCSTVRSNVRQITKQYRFMSREKGVTTYYGDD